MTYEGIPVVFLPFFVHISSITRIQLGNIKLLRVEDFVKLIVKRVIVLHQNKFSEVKCMLNSIP